MSGRTRWQLDDGEWVTGFRKTMRRVARCAVKPGPDTDFEMSFTLPDDLRPFVSHGPANVAGVTIEGIGRAIVTGRSLEWVCKQAAEFVSAIGGGREHSIRFHISRGTYHAAGEMIHVPGASVIFPRSVKKALVFTVKQ